MATILSSSIVGPFSSFKVSIMANRFGGISGFAFDSDGTRLVQVEGSDADSVKAETMAKLRASAEWKTADAMGF